MRIIGIAFLTVVAVLGGVGLADDWPAPFVRNVFSENGMYFVRIVPGQSVGDTVGFSGAPKGAYARGEFYQRQSNRSYKLIAELPLANPMAPVDALVTNAGYMLTFDNWHNVGYGKVVAIYRPGGRLVRSFTLEELYSSDRIKDIPLSVSSRWWRCTPHGFVDPDSQTEIYVAEHFGGMFTFKLAGGTFEYRPGQAECQQPPGPLSTTFHEQ